MQRPIHPDFMPLLGEKDPALVELFADVRDLILEHYPEANELLYHTHALTAVFTLSEKVSDAFCHIPVYSEHLNLGFNKGALLEDPDHKLEGSGKLIRHIPVKDVSDYRTPEVGALIRSAINLAHESMKGEPTCSSKTISKIK